MMRLSKDIMKKIGSRALRDVGLLIVLAAVFVFIQYKATTLGLFADEVELIKGVYHVTLSWGHLIFVGWYWGCFFLFILDELSTLLLYLKNMQAEGAIK